MNVLKAVSILFLLTLVLSGNAVAKTDTIYATYKYTMGDSDTKRDAKRIAFMEAKRLLLEKVGVYIESETNVRDSQITKDEIRMFSAAILKVQTAAEEQKFLNGSIVIITTVQTDVDPKKVNREFKRILGNHQAKKKIQAQQQQLQSLETKVRELQHAMTSSSYEKSLKLRKERNVVFGEISKLEKIKLAITNSTNAAIENIELGMTPHEVISLIGQPRAADTCAGDPAYNYGQVWVVFDSGVVSSIVKSRYFTRCESGQSYSSNERIK